MRKPLLVVLVAPMAWVAVGCSNNEPNILGGVPAIAYLSRAALSPGNVFDYAATSGSANIFTLTPPTASGKKTNVTNWTNGDIMSFDVSFDAREIAFSGKAPGEGNFHIYRINIDGSNPCDAAVGKATKGACQLTAGPFDDIYPIYVAGGQIVFDTNENVEGTEVPQFRDEYDRGTTAQLAHMNKDGTGRTLGARNVSHRVAPCLMSDGRILFTQWDHLGERNNGDLMTMNQDLTGAREGFGKEGTGFTNSYLRCREVSPGKIVAIGTSRDRTYQAGKILLINLGGPTIAEQSEATASFTDLTPLVPGDNVASFPGVGRFYDAVPIGAADSNQFLTSWSDGAVETKLDAMAQAPPDFGIYVYDAKSGTRFPVVNEIGTWETTPRLVAVRPEPQMSANTQVAQGTQSTMMAAINVYDSTMFPTLAPGAVKMVRVTEGFSTEEGFPGDFGLTEFDGQSRLGEVPLQKDGSFKVLVPAYTPIRFQLIDQFGMAAATPSSPGGGNASETIWTQGVAGEARTCGGCHNNRIADIKLQPGGSTLQAQDAIALDYPGVTRQERKSTVATFTRDNLRGVPWTTAVQAVFDNHCTVCHDGTKGATNPSYTLMDVTDMTTFSWTFDLTGREVNLDFGSNMYTYSASHISMLGPSMALREKQVIVTQGMINTYVAPGSAYDSSLFKTYLNPMRQYPTQDATVRAFPGRAAHPAEVGTVSTAKGAINGADMAYQLTPDEYFVLQVMADNGGQYFARENRPNYGGSN